MKYLNITNVLLVVLIVLTVGMYTKKTSTYVTNQTVAGAVGDTQSTPKMYQVQLDTATAGNYISADNRYQYASVVNGNSGDRIIESIEYVFTGSTAVSTSTALQNLIVATSSSATAGFAGNTNYVLNTSIATTTPTLYIASTTPGLTGTNYNRTWTAGTYLSIQSNATTTALGYFKINYLQE